MINIGDNLPDGTMKSFGANGPEDVDMKAFCKGKTVILVSVPGAFTPTCSAKHLPGFVENHDKLKALGVDVIACYAVNDVFVMNAWGNDQQVGDKVTMLADGSGEYTEKLGLVLDLTAMGLGKRSERFAMIIKDGQLTHIGLDQGGKFEASSAEAIIQALS